MIYILIGLCGIAAGAISGVVGTGSSIILLPVLSLAFGPKAAIPIMAVASIAGNASRVLAWRRQINVRAFAWYTVAAVPAAVLGVRTLWIMSVRPSSGVWPWCISRHTFRAWASVFFWTVFFSPWPWRQRGFCGPLGTFCIVFRQYTS